MVVEEEWRKKERGTLKGMGGNRRHKLSGGRGRHEEEMLTAARMKTQRVRSKVRINEEKLTVTLGRKLQIIPALSIFIVENVFNKATLLHLLTCSDKETVAG